MQKLSNEGNEEKKAVEIKKKDLGPCTCGLCVCVWLIVYDKHGECLVVPCILQ